jgi:hypothetical protein
MEVKIKISRVRSWIIILLILLVVVNSIAFYIYHISHPSEILCIQAWQYLESNTFKILNASIILPSLLVLLDILFKIGAKRKEEHEDRQLECIEKTSQMWSQLFSLVNEVRYFKNDDSNEARIVDIVKKMNDFTGLTGDIVNRWGYMVFRYFSEKDIGYSFSWNNIHKKKDSKRFLKNLHDYYEIDWVENAKIHKSEDSNSKTICINRGRNTVNITINETKKEAVLEISDGRIHYLNVNKENGKYYIGFSNEDTASLFLSPIIVLLYSTFAVAYYIECNNNGDEIPGSQYSLELIQEEIKKMTYHPTIDILKNSMYLEEGGKNATVAKIEIFKGLNRLKNFDKRLTYIQKEYIKLFPIRSNNVNVFKKQLERAESLFLWGVSDRMKFSLSDRFREIPLNERMLILNYPFTIDYVNCLAFYLMFESLNENIKSRTA